MNNFSENIFLHLRLAGNVANAVENAHIVKEKFKDMETRIENMEQTINKLLLINAAFFELIKDKAIVIDAELKSKILEIDARDGKIDGVISPLMQKCSKCNKAMSSKHNKCLYCGNEHSDPKFHSL